MMVARLFCNVLLTEAAAGRLRATSVIETMLRLATSPYLVGSGKNSKKVWKPGIRNRIEFFKLAEMRNGKVTAWAALGATYGRRSEGPPAFPPMVLDT